MSTIEDRIDHELAAVNTQIRELATELHSLQRLSKMLLSLQAEAEVAEPDPPTGQAAAAPPPKKKKKAKKQSARIPRAAQLEAIRTVFEGSPGQWMSTSIIKQLAGSKVTSAKVCSAILRSEWQALGLERKGARDTLRYRLPK